MHATTLFPSIQCTEYTEKTKQLQNTYKLHISYKYLQNNHRIVTALLQNTYKINTEYTYDDWSITYILYNTLTNYLNNYNLKEGKYNIKDQVLQLSQEVCPDNSIKTCFIQQNGKNIMNNRDSNLYNESTHEFI